MSVHAFARTHTHAHTHSLFIALATLGDITKTYIYFLETLTISMTTTGLTLTQT